MEEPNDCLDLTESEIDLLLAQAHDKQDEMQDRSVHCKQVERFSVPLK